MEVEVEKEQVETPIVEVSKDVVPKTEFEKLQSELEQLKNSMDDENIVKMTKEEFAEYKKTLNEESKNHRLTAKEFKEKYENVEKEKETLKNDLEALKNSMLEGLSEEDKALAIDLPIAKIPSFIKRINATNSQGIPNPAGRVEPQKIPQTLDEVNDFKFNPTLKIKANR
jgi:myosin heavy subunit